MTNRSVKFTGTLRLLLHMNTPTNLLQRLVIRNAELVKDPLGQEVLHVRDPHALMQASGYLKFTRAKEGEAIFFRGQSQTYTLLTPTLFRNIGCSVAAQSARVRDRNNFIDYIVANSPIFETFGKYAHEPLLQHWGRRGGPPGILGRRHGKRTAHGH